MRTTPEKVPISASLDGSRTAHLQPVIDLLKAEGNELASVDGFTFDRDGYGTCYFEKPLDMDLLKARFAFPPDIHLSNNAVFDAGNFIAITQRIPPGPPLTFGL